MPWSETTPMDQKTQFIADYLRNTLFISELCELYGISRKTGYKWIERYLENGPQELEDRSRKPRRSPNRTPDEICDALLEVRQHHHSWGAKNRLTIVAQRHPEWDLPNRSTVCDRSGSGNSDSRISGCFAPQSWPEGRLQEQQHDQKDKA